MKKPVQNLTSAEWSVMECLWESAPCTGREVVEALNVSVGWSRSTTLTMLRRMTEKGLIRCYEESGMNVYAPMVNRDDAVQQETDGFLHRVYKGSVSLLVSSLTKKQSLSQKEIDELYEILNKAKEENNND